MNYVDLLRTRARYAQPRRCECSHLVEANARALLAWRIRWHHYTYYPDAWPLQTRCWFNHDLHRKRNRAREWLLECAAKVRVMPDNVVLLKSRGK